MKKKNKKDDDIINVAYENIIADRKKLEELFSSITEVARTTDGPLTLAAVSEHLVKITDSLTKQTAQLVEIAKIKQKTQETKNSTDEFSESELDELYIADEKN